MSIEIEAEDIVRLVLQFLKENSFNQTAQAIETETGVKINTIENRESFMKEIKDGEWDMVLRHVADLRIPPLKLMDLYEQVVLELTELRELGAARTLLRQTEPMFLLKNRFPERYLRLEHILSRSAFDPKEIYVNGITKEKMRSKIAQALANEVTVVEPGRLMTLLEDCVKWQQHQGLLAPDTPLNLFQDANQVIQIEDEMVQTLETTIKFPGKKSYAECTAFSPNGLYLVTGSVDGFIEIWNHQTGKLRKDLKYQAEENLMAMDQSVICVNFSQDSESLVTGSTDGKIALWKVQSGHCQRKISPAHSQGVTSVAFNKDTTHILSSSYDHSIKIHNVKSGKLVKSLDGHVSFVNSAVYSSDYTQVISGSSDGEVKIWDIASGVCLHSIQPDYKVAVQSVVLIPYSSQFIAVTKSHQLHILNTQGKRVKMIEQDKSKGDFISAALSHQGKLVYGLSETGILSCHDLSTGYKGEIEISQDELIGISSHPFTNRIAVNDIAGRVYLYTH
ncbi:WD40 repeat-containing protein SMU1 [Pilobolus umbonatus]|nr:WD40 repeat-containing protein SMU1 [Pilobolus umbonatus]